MCFSSSNTPSTPAPQQESKQPDFQAMRDARKKRALQGGSLLTGESGVALQAQGTQAKPTLLGQ